MRSCIALKSACRRSAAPLLPDRERAFQQADDTIGHQGWRRRVCRSRNTASRGDPCSKRCDTSQQRLVWAPDSNARRDPCGIEQWEDRGRCGQPIEDDREPLDLSRLSQESRQKSAARSIQLRFLRRWSVELLIAGNDASVCEDHEQANSKSRPLLVSEPCGKTFGRLTNPGCEDSGVGRCVPEPGRIAKMRRTLGFAHIRLVFV